MEALAEVLLHSIRCCIREHLEQEADVEAAVDAAAREIVYSILREIKPTHTGSNP